MAKATHIGTCQICGAAHKVVRGGIAKHGYTVGGYYRGVCDGSDAAPYERGTGALELFMEWLASRGVEATDKTMVDMARRIENWEAKELKVV